MVYNFVYVLYLMEYSIIVIRSLELKLIVNKWETFLVTLVKEVHIVPATYIYRA